MSDALPLAPAPELIFGLVGPIGVDLELVTGLLTEALRDVNYQDVIDKFAREGPHPYGFGLFRWARPRHRVAGRETREASSSRQKGASNP
jgi:hypothetical protein